MPEDKKAKKYDKDFIHKMSIANKEAKESKHFLRMAAKAAPEHAEEARALWKEAHELNYDIYDYR